MSRLQTPVHNLDVRSCRVQLSFIGVIRALGDNRRRIDIVS